MRIFGLYGRDKVAHARGTVSNRKDCVIKTSMARDFRESDDPVYTDGLPLAHW